MHTRKISCKWILAVACFLMVFICDGFAGGYRGLFLSAVSEGLGVKRTLVAFSESFRFLAGAVMGVFYGALRERFAAKKLICFGFSVLLGSLLLFSCTKTVYTFWIAGALMGIGMSFIGTTMASSLIRQGFDKNVGTVTGIVLASSGMGSALGSQVISPILYSGDPEGFRSAYRVTALVVLVVAAVIILLLWENQSVVGVVQKKKEAVADAASEPQSKGKIIVVAGCVFLCAASIMGVNSIYAAHMLDVGITSGTVGTAAGLLSLTVIGSKFLTGFLFDRLGLRAVLGICQAATLVAFGLLLFINETTTAMALIFPVILAVALPLETIMIPLIVADVFGTAAYNKLLGIISAVASAGFMVASPLSNLIFDACGSYRPAIIGNGCVMILVSLVLHVTISKKNRSDGNE